MPPGARFSVIEVLFDERFIFKDFGQYIDLRRGSGYPFLSELLGAGHWSPLGKCSNPSAGLKLW